MKKQLSILIGIFLLLTTYGYSQDVIHDSKSSAGLSSHVPEVEQDVPSEVSIPISKDINQGEKTTSKESLGKKYETDNRNATSARAKDLLPGAGAISFFGLIIRVIISLSIIGVLIYLVVRVFFKSQRWIAQGGEIIHVIDTCPLSPVGGVASNKYIQIVELGNCLLVLGISDHNINLLTKITEKETIDYIKTQSSKEVGLKGVTFNQLLEKVWKPAPKNPIDDYNKKIDFLKEQKQRLKDLELGR